MKDYVVVDVETANRERDICSIAVLKVRNNEVVDSNYTLIDPDTYFDVNNTYVNGINEADVVGAPKFDEYWTKNRDLLMNDVIVMHGHNQFDLNAICRNLARYNLDIPELNYLDTCTLARQFLELKSYNLVSLSKIIGYEFNHHNALEDTKATYEVFEWLNRSYDVGEPKLYVFDKKKLKVK